MALTWGQLEQHLGVARLAHYVDHCRGDQGQAIELYQWNAHLAAAFWHDLGHVEVALRNALDARMAHHHRIWAHDGLARYQDLMAVAEYIDPDFSEWIEDTSSVQNLLNEQPAAGITGSGTGSGLRRQ